MTSVTVTPKEFVEEFWLLKQQYLQSLVTNEFQSINLHSLNLTEEQKKSLPRFVDSVIVDILYTVLLGLDGAAQIGVKQVNYTVLDESGNRVVCGDGEVEALAYEIFYGAAL